MSGPPPRYATATCRVRAYRRRRSELGEAAIMPGILTPFEGAAHTSVIEVSSAPVEEQVERALLEARSLGTAFCYLGRMSRPTFAWRCTRVGEAILAALRDSFPEVDL